MADEEKQEPAKPKKEKGGLPVPLFGLIGFVIMLIALLVNVFLVLGIKSEVASITEVIVSGKIPAASGHEGKEEKKKKNFEEEDFSEEESSVGKYVADDKAEYFETGRITTNPRSSQRFVVLNLGMFFSEYPKAEGEEEEAKEEHKAEGPESFSPYGKKFDGMVKNIINSQIGSMSLEELLIPRDSLTLLFKQKLRPLFGQQEARLKEVAIIEFIVQ
jgi:hypothetical protein